MGERDWDAVLGLVAGAIFLLMWAAKRWIDSGGFEKFLAELMGDMKGGCKR